MENNENKMDSFVEEKKTQANGLGENIKTEAKEIGENLKSGTKDFGENFKNVTENLGENIKEVTEDLGENLKTGTKDFSKNFKSETKDLGEDIKTIKNVNLNTLDNNSKIVLGSLVVALISLFLPFYKVSLLGFQQSMSFIEGDGKVVLVLVVLGAIMFLIKKHLLSTIAIGISAIIFIYDFFNMKSELSKSSLSSNIGSFSIGFYLGLISLIVAIYFISKMKKESNIEVK